VGETAYIETNKVTSERYNANMEVEARICMANAIHLCPTCHKIVNTKGATGYTIELLREWKDAAEEKAFTEMNGSANTVRHSECLNLPHFDNWFL
jgi:hypothetical protein